MSQLEGINEATLVNILSKIANGMKDWIIISDNTGKIIYANDSVFKECSYQNEQILGQDMCMFVGVDLTDEETLKHIQTFINDGEKYEFITSRFIRGNRRIYLANTLTTIWAENALEYYVCISKDISNTLKLKEEYYKANYMDPLTNFPNQKVFLERLDKQLVRHKRNRKKLGIVLLDIEGIGNINTEYGISIGDYVIKEVGKRIGGQVELQQEVYKYNGNAFVILCNDIQDESEVEALLINIYRAMEAPIELKTRYVYVTLRAGIALSPKDALGSCQLIELAQIALTYGKKRRKLNKWTFYSMAIKDELEWNKQVEEDLQCAVENDEFIVYFQPFVDLREEKLVGMEALIRRQKQDGQIISPAAFLSTLEQMNLIERVGLRVLEKVCIQLRAWLDKGYPVVPISVNLSALQFRNPNLAEQIEEMVHRYEIAPAYIVLEVTETTVMDDIESAKKIIASLRAYGFAISIDDFGTGYASIGYLKKFVFDHLKIDMSFIREIVVSVEDRAIVEAIVAIAKCLHLKTIAEGIENEDQLYVVSALGCEMGQGYFWDKPICAESIEHKYFMGY